MKKLMILSVLAALLCVAVPVLAGGPLYSWQITAVKGNALTVKEISSDKIDSVELTKADLSGLVKYFGVKKVKNLVGRKFSGNDLKETLKDNSKRFFMMSDEDIFVEILAKGILTFDDFSLPKGMMLERSDFKDGKYLDKGLLAKLQNRIEVLSNGICELSGADRDEFSILPRAMCYATFAVIETKHIIIGKFGGGPEHTSKSVKVHRFSIAADCSNAVQFDRLLLTPVEFSAVVDEPTRSVFTDTVLKEISRPIYHL